MAGDSASDDFPQNSSRLFHLQVPFSFGIFCFVLFTRHGGRLLRKDRAGWPLNWGSHCLSSPGSPPSLSGGEPASPVSVPWTGVPVSSGDVAQMRRVNGRTREASVPTACLEASFRMQCRYGQRAYTRGCTLSHHTHTHTYTPHMPTQIHITHTHIHPAHTHTNTPTPFKYINTQKYTYKYTHTYIYTNTHIYTPPQNTYTNTHTQILP